LVVWSCSTFRLVAHSMEACYSLNLRSHFFSNMHNNINMLREQSELIVVLKYLLTYGIFHSLFLLWFLFNCFVCGFCVGGSCFYYHFSSVYALQISVYTLQISVCMYACVYRYNIYLKIWFILSVLLYSALT